MWNTEGFLPTSAAPLDVEGELEIPGIGSSTLGDNILGSEFMAPGTGISIESNEPVVRSMQGPDLLMSNELLFDSAEDVGSDETGVDPITGTITPNNTDNLNLDIDGNGEIDALTDGLLAVYYLFGFFNLLGNAVGAGASRDSDDEIINYLNGARDTMLDVDGNGLADALTDGLVLIGYMFGQRGEGLINRRIGDGATRTTAAEIEQFLDQFATLTPNPNILFFEDFESDLSRWTGKGRGPTSGIIVPDPLQGDRALSFTELASGGDIFTLEPTFRTTNCNILCIT